MTRPDDDIVQLLDRLARVEPDAGATARAVERVRAAILRGLARRLSRWRPLTLAAGLLLAVGVPGLAAWLLSGGAGTGLAFADVQEKVRQTRTLTATWSVETPGKPPQADRVWIMAPGRLRVESGDGTVSITDAEGHRALALDPAKRAAFLIEGFGQPMPDIYGKLRNVRQDVVKALPVRQLGGKKVPGFLVRGWGGQPGLEASVWVDPDTQLPVRLEIDGKDDQGRPARFVMSDFVFDRALDPALFNLAVPQGYKLRTEGAANFPPPPKDKDLLALVVTPRVGMGPVRFGMSKEEVIRVLGQPDTVQAKGTVLGYYSRGYALTVSPKRGVVWISCVSQPAYAIRVRDFKGKTKEGIGIGAHEKGVEKAYGKAGRRETNGPETVYLEYPKLGLHFTLFNDKVVELTARVP